MTGFGYFQEGKYQLAIDQFQRALENKSTFHPARIWLGRAYFQAGFIDNTVDEWQTACDMGYDDNVLRMKLNELLATKGVKRKFNIIDGYSHFDSYYGHKLQKGKFLKPASLLVNGDNNIFVTGFLSKNVVEMDVNGDLKEDFSIGFGGLKKPFGIAKAKSGYYFVSDFEKDLILKLDTHFKKLIEFGGAGITNATFAGPEGMVVDKNGHLLVVDNGNNRIQKFDSDGTFIMSFGSKGNLPGELYRPSGITIDKNGYIYVSDYGNRRIQKFDEDGNFIDIIGEGTLMEPRGLTVNGDTLMVADGPNGIYFYDLKDKFWWVKSSWNGGEFRFANAIDIAFNPVNEALYVADFDRNSVDVFMPSVFKYSDLDVTVNRTHLDGYPVVGQLVTVKARNGRYMTGLTTKNFKILEDKVPVQVFTLDDSFREKNTVIFLADKSRFMQKYNLEIQNAADLILNRREKNDQIKLINVNDKVWTGLDFNSLTRLRMLDKLVENKFTEDCNLGRGLYQAVSEMVLTRNKKAIVLFTAGKFVEEYAFKDYEFEVVLNFAKNNQVPIHIIAFTEENRNLLEKLAKETDGEYFYYFENSRKMRDIYSLIDDQIQKQYILVYKSSFGTDQRKWREVEVFVDVQKLSGRDVSGYFLPPGLKVQRPKEKKATEGNAHGGGAKTPPKH